MTSFFSSPGRNQGQFSAQVKAWARKHLVGDEPTLVVSELACSEPGCPPIETVIAVVDVGQQQTWKIHRPLSEVEESDVQALLSPNVHDAGEH